MRVVSWVIYAFCRLLSYLPFSVLYLLSDISYFVVYYLVGYRRKVVRVNLTNAFPEKEKQEIIRIERGFYRHLTDTSFELYKMWRMSEKEMRRRCVFRNPEVPARYLAEGRGVIAVLGHYGNWEWLSSYALWIEGHEFLELYKPLHNPVLDKMMQKIRSRFGARPVPKASVLRVIRQCLDDKKSFVAGFIGDQTPNSENLRYWMDFLHQETPVLPGTEKIARKYGLPVVTVSMNKVKRGYYEVIFTDLCSDPMALPAGRLTECHMRILEASIRRQPELWLWSHRRWKYKRTNENTEYGA